MNVPGSSYNSTCCCSRFSDQGSACDQQQTAKRTYGFEDMHVHPKPAEVVDQKRGDQRGGDGNGHERSCTNTRDQCESLGSGCGNAKKMPMKKNVIAANETVAAR